jgi:hypothetical protein
MSRHYYDRKAFCSAKCLAAYKGHWERLKERLRSLFRPPVKEIGHASLHLLRHALLLAVALPKRMAANKVIGGYTL